jgi:hypothetical protein
MVWDGPVLSLDRAGPEHSGFYECRAVNTEGRAKDTIRLEVLCK